MRLILDTVSQLRGCATQLDTSQLGEVTNAMSRLTRHYHSAHNPHHRRFPSLPPSSIPALFPAGPAWHTPMGTTLATPTQHQHLRTDTDVLSRTPACTTSPDVSNPTPVCATQHQHVWPNTSVLSPASTSQHRHFEPNASVYDQHRPL